MRLAPAPRMLWLAEGVEDALSLIQMTGMPVWAVLGTNGFKNVLLPEHIAIVTLAPDGDEAGQAVIEDAAKRLASQGREVRIARPRAKDWNEALADFEERAAIIEMDGKQERRNAEMIAGREVAQ